MSSLVSAILDQSFREANYTAVGASPTAAELAEALPRLNNYISALFGFELGELYRDWYVPTLTNPTAPIRSPLIVDGTEDPAVSWQYPPANARLVVHIPTAATLYFPAFPSDGARMYYVNVGATANLTLHANGRLIEGAASIVATPATLHTRSWFYRADLGDWIRLKTLIESDEVPLPLEFDDLLITGLAIRLAARMGSAVDQTTAARHSDMLSRLKKRYKQTEMMPQTNGDLSQQLPDIATGL